VKIDTENMKILVDDSVDQEDLNVSALTSAFEFKLGLPTLK